MARELEKESLLRASQAACRAVCRASGSSFCPAFCVLPRECREAMEALYAFMHHTDAIADCDLPAHARRWVLKEWRETLLQATHPDVDLNDLLAPKLVRHVPSEDENAAHDCPGFNKPTESMRHLRLADQAFLSDLMGDEKSPHRPMTISSLGCAEHLVPWFFLPAVVNVIREYDIPLAYLTDVLDGVEADLDPFEMPTRERMEDYCHKVATAVGLASLRIWKVQGDEGEYLSYARACGLAFQRTNILRDVREDALRGRVYIPTDALLEAGYSSIDAFRRDVLGAEGDSRFESLMESQCDETVAEYRRAVELHRFLPTPGRRIYGIMLSTYARLLHAIERAPRAVLTQRVRVPKWRKLLLLARWTMLPPTKPTLPAFRSNARDS